MLVNKNGFTLIELAITIAIGVVLAVAAIPIYGSLQISTQLNQQSAMIVQAIRSVRELSVASFNNSNHGIYFQINPAGVDSYIIYQGPSYLARNTTFDQVKVLEGAMDFLNSGFVLTGTDIDINFSKSIGVPNNIGTMIIYHNVSGQRNVSINNQGAVTED